MRRLAVLAVLLATGIGVVAFAMLPPITFEEFSKHATCACLVEVVEVENVTGEDLRSLGVAEAEVSRFNLRARLRFARWIVEGHCGLPGEDTTFIFSTEVHSAHPEVGHHYVLLPRRVGKAWAEVIYGRSVWEVGPGDEVDITLQNDFLIAPLEFRSGEIGHVPLASIERLLTRVLDGSQH